MIVPAHTFIATWLAVSQCGAIPVPVEPLESTCNIDPDRIEAAITGFAGGQFPIAERMANQILSLPIGPQLDNAGVEAVIAAVKKAAIA